MSKKNRIQDIGQSFPGFDKLKPVISDYWQQVSPRPDIGGFEINLGSYDILFNGGEAPANNKLYVSYHFLHPNRKKLQKPIFWAAPFFKKNGLAGINVCPKVNCWYQHSPLRKFFRKVNESGWFDHFDRRVTYGESMGATGALWHADIVKADTLMAFSPQVSLDDDVIAKGERRFPEAGELEWDRTVLRERLRKLPDSTDILGIFDPRLDLDHLHMDLMDEATDGRARMVHLPYVGHSTISLLGRAGTLSKLILLSGEGPITEDFIAEIRQDRKKYSRWLQHLELYNRQRSPQNRKQIASFLAQQLKRDDVIEEDEMHPSHEKFMGKQAKGPFRPFKNQ